MGMSKVRELAQRGTVNLSEVTHRPLVVMLEPVGTQAVWLQSC